MRRRFRKWLVLSFEPALPDRRRRRLERELAARPGLGAQREEMAALRLALADSAAHGFAPGFADRVLARLAASPAAMAAFDALALAYRMVFERFALVAGLITAIMVLINLLGGALVPSREIPFASALTFASILKTPLW
jgi:hypothetical protein